MRFRVLAKILSGALTTACVTVSLAACGDDAMPTPAPATYEEAEMVLGGSCAFGASCHGGAGAGQARLNFQSAMDAGDPLTSVILDAGAPRPSCEYSQMPLVDPGNADNSWLMIKIAGSRANGEIEFMPDPAWDTGLTPNADGSLPASVCPLTEGGELVFGGLMPLSIGAPVPLDPSAVETLRSWINAGAPGPDLPAP